MAPQTQSLHPQSTPNFDPIARAYRWMEYLSFGPMLERCRFYFLANCVDARCALVLGDGDGRFTARLLAINRNIHVDAIDSSAAMLALLKRRAMLTAGDAESRLRTIHADLRHFTPNRSEYDLVVSHFFLDCLTNEEFEEMVARIAPHLALEATWVISEFSIPQKSWRRIAARTLIRFLYFAFRKVTHLHVRQIQDYACVLTRSGFTQRRQDRFLGGLLIAEQWQKNSPGPSDLS